jgi:hypothetical protein
VEGWVDNSADVHRTRYLRIDRKRGDRERPVTESEH